MARFGTRYLLNNYRIILRIPKWELDDTMVVRLISDDIAYFKSGKYMLILRQNSVRLSVNLTTHEIIYMSTKKERYIQTCLVNPGVISHVQEVYDVKCYNDWYKYIQV